MNNRDKNYKGINYDDEFCDCDCLCAECDNEGCNCECDCECISNDNKNIRFPTVHYQLPRYAGKNKLPENTPIKVRIPRRNIFERLMIEQHHLKFSEQENSQNVRTASKGTINVCVFILPGAKVGGISSDSHSKIPSRIRKEIDAANSIWKKYVDGRLMGVSFKIIKTILVQKNLRGVVENAQNFPDNDEMPQILLAHGRKVCPHAHVFVFYMGGSRIGASNRDGSQTNALTYRAVPVIVLSDGAQSSQYILAHELGHFLYLNNRFGNIFDPNPFPGDPDHNQSKSNLMYPRSDFWPPTPKPPTISDEQIIKALNTRFFYR